MAVETPYTTEELVTRLIGRLGIDLRADDAEDDTEENDFMQDAIDQGTTDLDVFLVKFNPADIAADDYCIKCATWFAVRAICERRGNDAPASIKLECERREKFLELVRSGKAKLRLPNSRRAATVSNYHVDLRRFNNQVRVDKTRSTGVSGDLPRVSDDTAPNDK